MALNTRTTATAWSPDLSTFQPADVVPDALIIQSSTLAGTIEGDAPAVRVAYVDDATATFTAEGAEIPESDPALNEVLVHTAKITQLVRLSREQYAQTGTAEQLSESVRRAITRKADGALLTQTAPVHPAVAPPTGLLNVTGTRKGEPVTGNLDELVDLIAQLEGAGAAPSHIILDPVGWATLRKIKAATGSNTTLLGAGTNDAERRLLDLPVIVSPAMTASSGLVIDRNAIVSATGDIQVATSDQVYFTADSIALRATWRIGWNIVRPDRIGTFTIDA